ncbi:nucleoside-binding protein [Pseudoalteromonas luteoviolacea]|uniref:nucleoside-binding protein n=1 Tax=Pseudoalteromonas luteoviolacea TaxID=43657 RepID=UPI001F2F0E5C|nr:nucleoside-binding protein [Pseudoalteromonas luteoviolacea]MCF6439368.1 nucleoside-binding protein [Pseudoalteromonas luteoviolacea]
MNNKLSLALSTALTCITSSAYAADWSNTQLHINHGDFKNPFSQNEANTTVYSLQHSSGYQYGDNFFFIDYLVDDLDDDYQDRDFYGEWYSTFSLSKTAGLEFQNGAIKHIGLVAGFNMAGDSKVMKYLPGVKVSWNAEGFSFLSTLFTAYIDDNEGVARNGAPAESNSWMIDIAWGYPFNIGNQKFEVTGHVEYIAQRENELGFDVKGWLLAQPIIRWDLGHALEMSEGQLYLGFEWQYWRNKLGTDTNESVPQMHIAWTF